MRVPVKIVRPTPEAIAAVKDRMRDQKYFFRNEVVLWFGEFDPGLVPLNARRAADALLDQIKASHEAIVRPFQLGWMWNVYPAIRPQPENMESQDSVRA